MDHATTQTQSRAASRVLTDLAQVINRGLSVEDVFSLVVEMAVSALGGTSGSVMMSGDDEEALHVVAAIGPPDGREDIPREAPVAEWVMREDQPVLLIGRRGPLAHLLRREDIRDAVCVPLRYAGAPIGALSVTNSEGRGPFTEADVAQLTSIGHLAAVALRNTSLYEEVRVHRERLRAVLHQLWTTQEQERRLLAEDLHDGPAQSLYHIVFMLQNTRHKAADAPDIPGDLEKIEMTARATLAQVRALMAGLRPLALDDLGLVPALQSECAALKARGRVQVDVYVDGAVRRLGAMAETGLYRIAREALTNVERHARSEHATLEVRFTPEAVTLVVEDDGQGFDDDTAAVARAAGRIGLDSLHERAEALGATLEVRSIKHHGTRLVVHLEDNRPEKEVEDAHTDDPTTRARGQARRKETLS